MHGDINSSNLIVLNIGLFAISALNEKHDDILSRKSKDNLDY